MKRILFCLILCLLFAFQNLYAQCDFITPPVIKKINYATREFTFSNVTMNGKETTFLAVEKGETVKITTNVESRKNGDYCPDCIVQIYWGIRGYTSVCAKSFYGYQFNRKKSTLKFEAPMKDGIYYITMGAALDYSCKNNVFRPNCSPDDAFAVLKVGNPDPEKKITLTKVSNANNMSLKTTLVKSGCFGTLDKTEWFLDGEKLAYDNQQEIPLVKNGTYKVVWSNCLGSVADSFIHDSNEKEVINLSVKKDETPPANTEPKKLIRLSVNEEPRLPAKSKGNQEEVSVPANQGASIPDSTDIAVLIENNETFVLKTLIFDLSKSDIRPEAEADLNKLARIMKDKPSMKILLEGHTDRRGSARKNLALSEKRVESTKAYLVKQGISDSRIETKGWGHQKPLIITKNIEEGKINRRVEVRVLSR